MSDEQIAELKDIIEKGAKSYGFQNERWDSKRIAKVIKEKFNVIYNSNYVCELLKHHGLSCQKPATCPKIIVLPQLGFFSLPRITRT
ncbi:hypothetical protein FACS1894170_04740 [Planctomycetales bacterium]|nr:hypothetical protein FACS1894170_04740 [Planctomycetales bacterium]